MLYISMYYMISLRLYNYLIIMSINKTIITKTTINGEQMQLSRIRNKFSIIFTVLSLSCLTGCSWMREADLPPINQPSNFRSATSNTVVESLPYLAWWQQLNDPQLNRFIESSLANNLDIQVALANLEQAKGQLKQIQLSWIPFVNLYAGYSSNPAFGAPGNFYGIWPQYTLNIPSLINQQRFAKYNLQTQQAITDSVRLTVISEAAAGYLTLMAQQRQLELLTTLNNDIEQLLQFESAEIKLGISDDVVFYGIKSQHETTLAQIELAKHNITLSNNALSYLINANPSQIANSNNFAQLSFGKINPNALPATVLQNRPDIKIAQYQLQATHASVGIAYSNLFPAIQLDKFMGMASGNSGRGTPNTQADMTDAYLNWGINPSTFGQIEAQKGAYQADVYHYIQTVRKAIRDTDDSLSANNHYNSNYSRINNALTTTESKYKLQQGLYNAGMISYPQLIKNKIEVDSMLLTTNQAKLQQALTLVKLYQELAGGYKYESQNTNTNK